MELRTTHKSSTLCYAKCLRKPSSIMENKPSYEKAHGNSGRLQWFLGISIGYQLVLNIALLFIGISISHLKREVHQLKTNATGIRSHNFYEKVCKILKISFFSSVLRQPEKLKVA